MKLHFASIDEVTEKIVKIRIMWCTIMLVLQILFGAGFDNALSDLDAAIECDSTFFPAYFMRALIHYSNWSIVSVIPKRSMR